jgi:hypothetical protein
MDLNDLKKMAEDNLGKLLAVPMLMGATTWLANLLLAVSDGVIDEQEFHSLLQISSGSQTIILTLIMVFLKVRAGKK